MTIVRGSTDYKRCAIAAMSKAGARREPPPPLSVQFGQRLRTVREATGISQERLAHICGLDRTYVGSIERGKKNPSLAIVFRLAAGLEVDPTELVRGLVLDDGSSKTEG